MKKHGGWAIMTKIEWTGKTWNPITGCQRVSAGCQHCYAERMTKRLAAMGQPKYQGLLDANGRFNGVMKLDEAALEIPRKIKKPTVWFVNSMSDLFHTNVNSLALVEIWKVMRDTPQHTYQILTKRAKNMVVEMSFLMDTFGVLPNVWLGVSVENQVAADERIPHLLQTPAAIRFLSCEPLLGPVELKPFLSREAGNLVGPFANPDGSTIPWFDWKLPSRIPIERGVDWVIVGGESGPGARPMHPDWVRSLRDQCTAAGVPFFFKQWGEWAIDEKLSIAQWGDTPPHIIPNGMEVFKKVGKKAAGSMLDGREWKEMPEVNCD